MKNHALLLAVVQIMLCRSIRIICICSSMLMNLPRSSVLWNVYEISEDKAKDMMIKKDKQRQS